MFLTRKKNKQGEPAGVFYLVDTVNGKPVWRSTGTTEEATAQQILRESEASRGLVEQKRRDIRKLIVERATATSELLVTRCTAYESAWKIYLSAPATADMKPSSLTRVKTCFETFARYLESQSIPDIESVEFADAEAFLKSLTASGRSPGTVQVYQRNLHCIFRRIRRPLGLLDNPFSDVYIPPIVREKRRPFTDAELVTIFKELRLLVETAPTEALREFYEELFGASLLSLWTGLRYSDCVFTERSDIDFTKRWVMNTNRKLERYERQVSVPMQDRGDLLTYLQWRVSGLTSDRLFPILASRYEQKDTNTSRWFTRFLARIGIEETKDGVVCFHCFRHTNNTRLADTGADKGTRMDMLGHTTERVNDLYNHSTLSQVRAVNALNIPSMRDTFPQERRI